MEKLSKAEAEMLAKLKAKKARVERADRAFLLEADKRRDELLSRWGKEAVLKFFEVSEDEIHSLTSPGI